MINEALVLELQKTKGLNLVVDAYLLRLKELEKKNLDLGELSGLVGFLLYVSNEYPDSFQLMVSTIAKIEKSVSQLSTEIKNEINTEDAEGGSLLVDVFFEKEKLSEMLVCLEEMPFLSLNYQDKKGNTFLHKLAYVYKSIHTFPIRCSYDMDDNFEEKRKSLFDKIKMANKIVDFLSDQKTLLERWTSKNKYIYNNNKQAALDIFMDGYNPDFFSDIQDSDKELLFFLDVLIDDYSGLYFLNFKDRLSSMERELNEIEIYFENLIMERFLIEESDSEEELKMDDDFKEPKKNDMHFRWDPVEDTDIFDLIRGKEVIYKESPKHIRQHSCPSRLNSLF